MAKKIKKATWGGARKGSGRKFTGVNTVRWNLCVHKDLMDEIKVLVKAKIKEFKERQAAPSSQTIKKN